MRQKWEEYFPERIRTRKRCRRAAVLVLLLLLLPLYIWRIGAVNIGGSGLEERVVPFGEEVGFGSNYIDDPQLQNSEGYFIRVVGAEVLSREELLERSVFTKEDFDNYLRIQGIRRDSLPDYVALIETEIRNESNTETGIDCIFWRLQTKTAYFTSDSTFFHVMNPDTKGSERFRLKVGMTKTIYIVYSLYEHLWPEAPERILEEDPLLVLTEAPVSLRMKLK